MSEKFKFDFSMPADQEQFGKLDQEEKDEIIHDVMFSADVMRGDLKSGQAEDYSQAEKIQELRGLSFDASFEFDTIEGLVNEAKSAGLNDAALQDIFIGRFREALARGWDEDSRTVSFLKDEVFNNLSEQDTSRLLGDVVREASRFGATSLSKKMINLQARVMNLFGLNKSGVEKLRQQIFDHVVGYYSPEGLRSSLAEIFSDEEYEKFAVDFFSGLVRKGYDFLPRKELLDGVDAEKVSRIKSEENIRLGMINSIGLWNGAAAFVKEYKPGQAIINNPDVQQKINSIYPSGLTIERLIEIQENREKNFDLDEKIKGLNVFKFDEQIDKILKAQSEAAFMYLDSIKKIKNFQELSSDEAEYITLVAKKYGTKARNILENLIANVGVGNIVAEKEVIEKYLIEIGVVQFSVYQQYKNVANDSEKVTALKEQIVELQDKVYYGQMNEEKDYENELYPAISYHVFPPAIGLTQDQYNHLNAERPDRWDDVPEILNELQGLEIEVATGKYHLGEGKELNLDKWILLQKVISRVNTERSGNTFNEVNGAEVGGRIVQIYIDKTMNSVESQEFLFENMYRYHLSQGGGRMQDGFEVNISGLMQYKEFIGDRIKNDLIKDCLKEWRKTHVADFTSLKTDTVNRIGSDQKKNLAKVSGMLKNIARQEDLATKERAIKNLDEFLKHYNLSYESIKNFDSMALERGLEAINIDYEAEGEEYRSEEFYNSEAFLGAYDKFLAKHDTDELVYRKISSDLVAGINKSMRKEIDKFEFDTEGGGEKVRKFEIVISKKREHGVAGYNMGVCVTPDEHLWNDPEFMNCIMFDPELKQAMGGMHFLIRENNLCLPGINPSLDVLGQVENGKLYDKMIDYALKVKEKLGLKNLLIPTDAVIFSNRTQIQEIVRNKNYEVVNLTTEAVFSYDPYEYSFQECFRVG
jgi:hypothetical protein